MAAPENWKDSGVMPSSDTQFKPGSEWRGNAGGRPKTPLKDYVRATFAKMTDDEKKEFLRGIPKEVQWKMAEGNPEQETDITSRGEKIGELSVEQAEQLLKARANRSDIPRDSK